MKYSPCPVAETAQLAIRAALTGHLVLSTLHTNDALAAIPRLRDLGVESFLLAASLRLVAAQRLVRRLCAECKEPHPDNARLREAHRMPDAHFCRPVGCPACRMRGFQGRLAIHEVIPAEKFLPLIAANAPLAELAALGEVDPPVRRNLLFDHKYSSANFKNIVHRLGRIQNGFCRNFRLKKVNHQ